MLEFNIKKNQYITSVEHTGVIKSNYKQKNDQTFDAPINLEEGYKQIVYPVRRDFIEDENNRIEKINPNAKYDYIYTPFENTKVEFSTFIKTPTRMEVDTRFYIRSEHSRKVEFELSTCGKVVVFVNGTLQVTYAPFTRNINSSSIVELDLETGDNEIVVRAIDIAERDVFYYYKLKLLSDLDLVYFITPKIDVQKYINATKVLDSLYLIKDVFRSPKIEFEYKTEHDIDTRYYFSYGEGFENYFESDVNDNWIDVDMKNKYVDLSNHPDFMSYITFQTYIDGYVISKRFFVSKLEAQTPKIDDLKTRMEFARDYISKYGQTNVNKSLILLSETGEYTSEVEAGLHQVLEIVECKGDCADFYIVPLLIIIKDYINLIPVDMQKRIKSAIIEFRYWIDEPGSDVMWWFSENHALLFHIAQYVGGHLYQDELFTVSNRTGVEQYEIGKQRLIDWFEIFNKYGLAEWNSTTYIPIDLIGFISLYELSPDQEIKQMAKEALDRIFKIIAINFNGDQMACSYGRGYEKELKAMEFGELSFITWMVWGSGYVNTTSRSTSLMALTSYQVPDYSKYLIADEEGTVYTYKQGIKGVDTYLFKTANYAIGSVINYEPNQNGHQQHTFNISLGMENTQLWINHPGELVPSGENRPSYWAGNGIMPRIEQYKNSATLQYNLEKSEIKFVHMYIPYWKLDEINVLDKSVQIKKGNTLITVTSNTKVSMLNKGAMTNKEIRFYGSDITLFVTVSNLNEAEVEHNLAHKTITTAEYSLNLVDDGLLVNGEKINRDYKYLD